MWVEIEARCSDLDDQYRAGGVLAAVVTPRAGHHRNIRLGFRFLVERDEPLRPHHPTGSEGRTQRLLDETDRRVMRLTLGLGNDQLTAEQFDPVARLEHADLDQSVVFRARPSARLDTFAHGPTVAWPLDAVNVPEGIQSRA